MKKYDIQIKNVDDYIACQDDKLKDKLVHIRNIIRSVVPEAEELISYQIPCYKYHGFLVGFGTHKKGCSFYTMNPKLPGVFSKELDGFKYTGSTIHFDPQLPLPVTLIRKMIRYRIKENKEAFAIKKNKLKTKK